MKARTAKKRARNLRRERAQARAKLGRFPSYSEVSMWPESHQEVLGRKWTDSMTKVTHGPGGELQQQVSFDGGKNWSAPRPWPGPPSALVPTLTFIDEVTEFTAEHFAAMKVRPATPEPSVPAARSKPGPTP